jgi:hypothetical protein
MCANSPLLPGCDARPLLLKKVMNKLLTEKEQAVEVEDVVSSAELKTVYSNRRQEGDRERAEGQGVSAKKSDQRQGGVQVRAVRQGAIAEKYEMNAERKIPTRVQLQGGGQVRVVRKGESAKNNESNAEQHIPTRDQRQGGVQVRAVRQGAIAGKYEMNAERKIPTRVQFPGGGQVRVVRKAKALRTTRVTLSSISRFVINDKEFDKVPSLRNIDGSGKPRRVKVCFLKKTVSA